MSTKDYEVIAEVFATERARLETLERVSTSTPALLVRIDWALMAHAKLAGKLADVFAADNPNFDRSRFMRASGIGF